MSAPYDLSGLTNSTRVEHLFSVANTASNDLLAGGFLISIFIIITGSLIMRFGMKKALPAGFIAGFLMSMFMVQAEMVSPMFNLFFLAGGAFSTIYAYLTS
jgi:hypothetical protein